MRKIILTIATCVAASGAFGTPELGSIVASFNATVGGTPSTYFPWGLAYDGTDIWTGQAYSVAGWTATGSRKNMHPINGYCSETAYDRSAGRLYVIVRQIMPPYYVLGIDPFSGSVVNSFRVPPPLEDTPSGLTFGDGYLYLASLHQSVILKTTTDGSVVSSFDPGILKIKGLAWDGDSPGGPFLFACEMNAEHTIHQLKASSGSVVRSFDGPPFTGNIIGLTWDGEYLWACQNYRAAYMYAFQFIAHAPEPAVLPASIGKVKSLFR